MNFMMSHPWPTLTQWFFNWTAVAALLLSAVGLVVVWKRTDYWQLTRLILGVVVLVALLFSDVQRLSMMSYQSHMLEHIVVTLLVSPLIASAVAIKVSRSWATFFFLLFTSLVPLFHLTRLGGIVMLHSGGHDVELCCFLAVGVLFWLPVYGKGSSMGQSQKVLYVIVAAPVILLTGIALANAGAQSLNSTDMAMTMITLPDVHSGGVVMMWGGLAMVVQGLVLGTVLLKQHLKSVRSPGSLTAQIAQR